MSTRAILAGCNVSREVIPRLVFASDPLRLRCYVVLPLSVAGVVAGPQLPLSPPPLGEIHSKSHDQKKRCRWLPGGSWTNNAFVFQISVLSDKAPTTMS